MSPRSSPFVKTSKQWPQNNPFVAESLFAELSAPRTGPSILMTTVVTFVDARHTLPQEAHLLNKPQPVRSCLPTRGNANSPDRWMYDFSMEEETPLARLCHSTHLLPLVGSVLSSTRTASTRFGRKAGENE